MRIFAIRNDDLPGRQEIGYLLYYEGPKAFYIELPDDVDSWDVPILLDHFIKKGERTINRYWSRIWVQQRIVPQDRQNIGQVLKANGLSEYDEFALLLLSMGRCAQDNCYLSEIAEKDLPAWIPDRWKIKVEDVLPLSDGKVLVFFRNGAVKKYDTQSNTSLKPYFAQHDVNRKLFERVNVMPDGFGIEWSETLAVLSEELYRDGEDVPLTIEDFYSFVRNRVVNSAQACEILGCSRQNIDYLVKQGVLDPITEGKHKLFAKNDIVQRGHK